MRCDAALVYRFGAAAVALLATSNLIYTQICYGIFLLMYLFFVICYG
jgi:hypothetical protein